MKWYLATNEVDVFHYGTMEEEWEITTGQSNLFFYNTKEELIIALELYGQQYQESIIIEDTTENTPTEPPITELPPPE
jgi:hypothetical protein